MTLPTVGSYALVRKLAAGGMAEIYLARRWGEAGFFHDVVIKRLFSHLGDHADTLAMFQFEAKLMAHFQHPNIPQVYELGEDDGHWYIAMEYVEGPTVADLWRGAVRADVWMPIPVVMGIARQVAGALHHAHGAVDRAGQDLSVVHRDVTPHNILLTRDGIAKLVDFGVAQTAARPDVEGGQLRGTVSYMAPEQVRGEPLDPRADVFALGVILYELTTGTRLFNGSEAEVMTAVVERDARPPSVHFPGYPPELESLVMESITRDASQRVPNARAMAERLDAHAMRHGIDIGPAVVADFVRRVFPYTRASEPELAMVQKQRAASSHSLTHSRVQPAEAASQDPEDAQTLHGEFALDAAHEGAVAAFDARDDVSPSATASSPAQPQKHVMMVSNFRGPEDPESYLRDLEERLGADEP